GMVALVALGIAGWRITRREATAPPPVGAPVARDAGSERDLAYARSAEATGKLELAIAAYEEAQRTSETAPTAFKLGELHERLGRRADAARAFERYLVLAPEASDRDAVRTRIVALAALLVDAGVVAVAVAADGSRPDAGVKRTAPTPQGSYCMCVDAVSLCPSRATAPLCECRVTTGVGFGPRLCSVALGVCEGCEHTRACTDPRCDKAGRMKCPDPSSHVAGKTPDARCEGFQKEERRDGAYSCTWCRGVQLKSYRGQPGDRCHGFDRHTGVRTEGILDGCSPQAPDARTLDSRN
ncbi:MAG: tetratricopeptide repeat protein, partial [Myxococcota bacterium]|nr:tetratricopeptide repeat protein [Myxococcota bacterium]